MPLWSILILPCIFSVKSPEVCFPSVVRHRINSVFPTSRLFCISKQNDELEYQDVDIVQDEEQWNEYSKSRWEKYSVEFEQNPNAELLKFRGSSGPKFFKLPASISVSDFCQGTQNVEVNRNQTIRCKPLATTDILSQCTENSFLSALALFGNGEFIQRSENETMDVKRMSPEQLRSPVWDGTTCTGVVQSAHLTFFLNESKIDATEIHVEYANLPGNVDNKRFEQTFSVEFIQWKGSREAAEEEVSGNGTDPGVGYLSGGQVFRSQSFQPIPFAVPTFGHCYSGEVAPSPVLFLRKMSSVCTIQTINCDDARIKARSFYDQLYPSEFFSSPSEDAHPAKVARVNVTWEDFTPSSSTCRLPVSSLLQIYYSKQGSTKNYKNVIVAANAQLLLDEINYRPGQDIRMPITITFTDVTPPPKSIFASLPYIDIRLPHDFFYPFISSSALNQSQLFLIFLFVVFYTVQ